MTGETICVIGLRYENIRKLAWRLIEKKINENIRKLAWRLRQERREGNRADRAGPVR
ncbi:hypothetical protein Zm00014a_006913 [Zea mays]|uniref:Uncharacterized protein n=1 Tax=Zea mays TaxID=4577 RepID=A0A3L6FID6_MAIZE|nr:hypothetical protein Zm00014a_006913 [Zea mays]